MGKHGDRGVPLIDPSMRRQRVDAASVGQLLCLLLPSKVYDGLGCFPSGLSSAPHLIQSVQTERRNMVQLHGDAVHATESGMEYHTQICQNDQAGKESMVQLLTDSINISSVQDLSHYDTLGSVNVMPGKSFGNLHPFPTNEHGSSSTGGMGGPMQDLLNSFTKRMPDQFHMGINGLSVFPIEEIGSEIAADATLQTAESPSRLVVDESGYESSEASIYDVYSDDEDYAKGCIDLGEANSNVDQNLDGSHDSNVASEQVPSAYEQLLSQIDGYSPDNKEEEVPDCECIAGNPYLHVMTDLAEGDDDTITTRKKRNRNPTGKKRPDCRVTKEIGPIEIALRNAPYRNKYIFEPVVGITFNSEIEAYDFYNMYSWEVGFGIKKSTLKKNDDKTFTRRDLRCLCDGTPKDGQYKSKKTGCKAMIRLLRSNDDGWYISRHVAEHNHELTETCGQTGEWKSHRNIDASAIDMIKYLRENNVSLTKVHCVMGSMFGSMNNIPITKRSMRAICRQIAKDQMDDDWQKVLDTFREIRKQDEGFQFSVKLDQEKKNITSLLWINGKSRHQYQSFGDVITFDTTYCTNIYKMPFGLFVGVNNHFQTIIFGGVFMKDETIPSFQWVFEEFLSLMGGKLPQTVFTDQCAAMASALSSVWKGVKHLLCKWHIFKDAGAKLGPIYKWGSPFRKLFHKIINDMLTIDEFERAWSYMLDLYDLHDNAYLENIYQKREKWAKPYFNGTFCARMASTQRSESANHMLKRFVPRNCSMNRFVVQYNKLLFDRNSAEDRAEFDTKIFNNVRDRAWPVEEHAMKFYTAAAYGLFRKEIGKATDYLAIQKVENKEYDVVCAKPRKKHPWGREKYTVIIINDGERYDCECGLYQNFGMLCGHALRVIVQLGVCEIPKAHIHKRWTRSAMDILPERLMGYQKETLCMQSMTFRHSYLYVNAMAVVQDGNKDLEAFEIVAKYLKKAQKKLREHFKAKENMTSSENNGLQKGLLMQANYYTTESDVGVESGYETEDRPMNSYGAAGSCAGMSDSELLRIKAPTFKRTVGRPKQNRFKGAQDYYGKKLKRKYNEFDNIYGDNSKKKRALPRCGTCHILGHTSTQCKKKKVDLTTELPEF